ncbi:hypothetical protein ACMD2_26664, partial [Ananas comosus]
MPFGEPIDPPRALNFSGASTANLGPLQQEGSSRALDQADVEGFGGTIEGKKEVLLRRVSNLSSRVSLAWSFGKVVLEESNLRSIGVQRLLCI